MHGLREDIAERARTRRRGEALHLLRAHRQEPGERHGVPGPVHGTPNHWWPVWPCWPGSGRPGATGPAPGGDRGGRAGPGEPRRGRPVQPGAGAAGQAGPGPRRGRRSRALGQAARPGDRPSYRGRPSIWCWPACCWPNTPPTARWGLLARLHDLAVAQGRTGSVIVVRALQALVLDEVGDQAGTRAALAEALALAAPEGYLRVFVDEGAPMAVPAWQARHGTGRGAGQGRRPGAAWLPGTAVGRGRPGWCGRPARADGAQERPRTGGAGAAAIRCRAVTQWNGSRNGGRSGAAGHDGPAPGQSTRHAVRLHLRPGRLIVAAARTDDARLAGAC